MNNTPPLGPRSSAMGPPRLVHDAGLMEIRCGGVTSRQGRNAQCNALLCKCSPGSCVSVVCPKCGTLLFAHVPLVSPFVVAPASSGY